MSKKGLIYILLNPSFKRHLKIGKTQRTSEERAKEIYNQSKTGIPTEFVVAYEIEVSDCDLVENLVHNELAKHRFNKDREFFEIPLKEAISKIDKVIKELEKQHKLEFIEKAKPKEFNPKEWWPELSFAWQQIFRNHLDITYKPNEIDLIRAVHSIIDNCQEDNLRSKVLELVKDKKFALNLLKWYNTLASGKKLFNSYLPYELSESEIAEIFKLKTLNCSNNIAVFSLKPIEMLFDLEKLNCMNTYCTDLLPLQKKSKLEEIMMNYTKISSLEPLKDLPNLKKISCYGTNLLLTDIDNFKNEHPNCEIINRYFYEFKL